MEWLEKLTQTQNSLVIGLSVIFLLWIFSSTIRNLTTILEGVEKGYLSILKFLKWILSILLLPFKILIKIFKWIFTIKQRHDYKKYVLNTIYNVNPGKVKIPWLRKLFSYRIRRESKTRFHCIEQAIETQEFINNNLKYITMIETSVGGGKSSLMAGITHLKTIHFQKMIEKKITNTQKILYCLAWEKIDEIIKKSYQCNTKIDYVVNRVLDEFSDSFDGFYNNFRQDTPRNTLLRDYVTASCAKIRNNYVMANYKLFSRITNNFNFDLSSDLFNIKDPEARKNYYMPAYCIYVEDELSLSNLKNTSSPKEIDNLGRDTSMRLFRQLKNETSFYIGCSQNISRNAKIFRELANSYFEILSLDIIGTQKTYSRIFQKKEQKLENKLTKKRYRKKIPEIKKKIYELYQTQNKIYAAGYLKYTVRVAYNVKDLERIDKSNLKVKELVIPMTWCFGTYLKCQFSELDDYLNENSGKSDGDLKVIDNFFSKSDPKTFEEILENREEEKKKKEAEKKRKKEEAKKKEAEDKSKKEEKKKEKAKE